MICKLLAKNAEDRYQSAAGLHYDLKQCLDQLERTGQIEVFELGQNDFSDRLQIPQKLYGRETDIEHLLALPLSVPGTAVRNCYWSPVTPA